MIVAKVDTGTAELVPDPDLPDAWLLRLHGVAQSQVNLGDPTMIAFDYVRRLVDIIDALAPAGALDILHLGGGALTLPRCLHAMRPGIRQRVVELDGGLVSLILSHLPLADDDPTEVTVSDARKALETMPSESADVIVADIFSGVRPPPHVTTVEFVQSAARVLRPGGCYLLNIMDRTPLLYARRMAATLNSVFPEVAVVIEASTLRGHGLGNLLMAAGGEGVSLRQLPATLAGDPGRVRVELGTKLTEFLKDAKPFRD